MSAVQSGVATEEIETEAVARLVGRLEARFPQVPALTVERMVWSIHQSFDGARVRSFVPLLVEHEAATRHKALAQHTREDPPAPGAARGAARLGSVS
jgi:hypothetical protein